MTAPVGFYTPFVRAGDLAFVSGQVGLESGALVDGFEAQVRQILTNLTNLLESNGLTLGHIVKNTVFLTDANDFARLNEIYAEFFKGTPPARSTVIVAGLPLGALVEIEAIAYVG